MKHSSLCDGCEELQKLREKLPILEAEEEKAREALAAAEAAVEEEKRLASANGTEPAVAPLEARQEAPQELPQEAPPVSDAPGRSTSAALEMVKSTADAEKPVVSEYSKWMDGADKVLEDKADDESGDKQVVSEYSKWMDGAEKVLEADSQDAQPDGAASVLEHAAVPDEEEESGLMRLKAKVADVWNSLKGWVFGNKTPAEKALEKAKDLYNAAKKQLRHDKVRIAELEPWQDIIDHSINFDC